MELKVKKFNKILSVIVASIIISVSFSSLIDNTKGRANDVMMTYNDTGSFFRNATIEISDNHTVFIAFEYNTSGSQYSQIGLFIIYPTPNIYWKKELLYNGGVDQEDEYRYIYTDGLFFLNFSAGNKNLLHPKICPLYDSIHLIFEEETNLSVTVANDEEKTVSKICYWGWNMSEIPLGHDSTNSTYSYLENGTNPEFVVLPTNEYVTNGVKKIDNFLLTMVFEGDNYTKLNQSDSPIDNSSAICLKLFEGSTTSTTLNIGPSIDYEDTIILDDRNITDAGNLLKDKPTLGYSYEANGDGLFHVAWRESNVITKSKAIFYRQISHSDLTGIWDINHTFPLSITEDIPQEVGKIYLMTTDDWIYFNQQSMYPQIISPDTKAPTGGYSAPPTREKETEFIPDIAINNESEAYIVWRFHNAIYMRNLDATVGSVDASSIQSQATTISETSTPKIAPRIESNTIGTPIIAWECSTPAQGTNGYSIYHKYIDGTDYITNSINYSGNPEIAISDDKIILLTWNGSDNGTENIIYENNYGDSDLDGIPDTWEEYYNFDPENANDATQDADGDGLSNIKEYLYGMPPWLYQYRNDSSNLSIYADKRLTIYLDYNQSFNDSEIAPITESMLYWIGNSGNYWNGTNPLNVDTDGDGLWDGKNPTTNAGEDVNLNGNYDDKFSDFWILGNDGTETDARNKDSDFDGLWDGKNQTSNAGEDVDLDGILDSDETSPTNPDSDNDGLIDGYIILYRNETVIKYGEDINCNNIVDPGETNPVDFDTDDDGLGDGSVFEGFRDDDNDSLINALDSDSDNDSIPDSIERGMTNGNINITIQVDGRTIQCTDNTSANFSQDGDPLNKTSSISVDSDNDGLTDDQEDSDLDGIWDPGETDAGNYDTDGDGLYDGFNDANGDGIFNDNETGEDVNLNGITESTEADPLDLDSDDDGLWDGHSYEGFLDSDDDNIYNFNEKDSDGDHIYDGIEIGLTIADIIFNISYDGQIYINGTNPDYFTGDSDNGNTTTSPILTDSDSDGLPDGWVDGWGYNLSDGIWGISPQFNEYSPGYNSTSMNVLWDSNNDSNIDFIFAEFEDINFNGKIDGDTNLNGKWDNLLNFRLVTNSNTNVTTLVWHPENMETWNETNPSPQPIIYHDRWYTGADTDLDGLTDGVEIITDYSDNNTFRSTSPISIDSDGDKLWDGSSHQIRCTVNNLMYRNGGELLTNPTNNDTDNDGLYDGFFDEDNDGYFDRTNEDLNNNNSLDPGEDIDGDNHLDYGEFGEDVNLNSIENEIWSWSNTYGFETNPVLKDTDRDNIDDGVELGLIGIDNDNGSTTTNPLDVDSDDDGLPDGWIDGWTYNEYASTIGYLIGSCHGFYQNTLSTTHDTKQQSLEGEDFDGDGIVDSGNWLPNYNSTSGLKEGAETDPNLSDTDSDDIPDRWEVSYDVMNPIVDDSELNYDDDDGDSVISNDTDDLSNIIEYLLNLDPGDGSTYGCNDVNISRDFDGDGLPDWWERMHDLNWKDNGSEDFSLDSNNDSIYDNDNDGNSSFGKDGDPDNDNMTNSEEYLYKNPHYNNWSSYLVDWETYLINGSNQEKVNYNSKLDPMDPDTDNDQLFDEYEVNSGSNPLLEDTDLDGYDDYIDGFPILGFFNNQTEKLNCTYHLFYKNDTYEYAATVNSSLGVLTEIDVDGDTKSDSYLNSIFSIGNPSLNYEYSFDFVFVDIQDSVDGYDDHVSYADEIRVLIEIHDIGSVDNNNNDNNDSVLIGFSMNKLPISKEIDNSNFGEPKNPQGVVKMSVLTPRDLSLSKWTTQLSMNHYQGKYGPNDSNNSISLYLMRKRSGLVLESEKVLPNSQLDLNKVDNIWEYKGETPMFKLTIAERDNKSSLRLINATAPAFFNLSSYEKYVLNGINVPLSYMDIEPIIPKSLLLIEIISSTKVGVSIAFDGSVLTFNNYVEWTYRSVIGYNYSGVRLEIGNPKVGSIIFNKISGYDSSLTMENTAENDWTLYYDSEMLWIQRIKTFTIIPNSERFNNTNFSFSIFKAPNNFSLNLYSTFEEAKVNDRSYGVENAYIIFQMDPDNYNQYQNMISELNSTSIYKKYIYKSIWLKESQTLNPLKNKYVPTTMNINQTNESCLLNISINQLTSNIKVISTTYTLNQSLLKKKENRTHDEFRVINYDSDYPIHEIVIWRYDNNSRFILTGNRINSFLMHNSDLVFTNTSNPDKYLLIDVNFAEWKWSKIDISISSNIMLPCKITGYKIRYAKFYAQFDDKWKRDIIQIGGNIKDGSYGKIYVSIPDVSPLEIPRLLRTADLLNMSLSKDNSIMLMSLRDTSGNSKHEAKFNGFGIKKFVKFLMIWISFPSIITPIVTWYFMSDNYIEHIDEGWTYTFSDEGVWFLDYLGLEPIEIKLKISNYSI